MSGLYSSSRLINQEVKCRPSPIPSAPPSRPWPIRPVGPSWLGWRRGEATVTELAAPFDLSLPAVSKHLKVLQRAGLIEQGRQAQWRPCRLTPEPLRDVAGWIGQYRRHWEESFERLDDYLKELQEKEQT